MCILHVRKVVNLRKQSTYKNTTCIRVVMTYNRAAVFFYTYHILNKYLHYCGVSVIHSKNRIFDLASFKTEKILIRQHKLTIGRHYTYERNYCFSNRSAIFYFYTV